MITRDLHRLRSYQRESVAARQRGIKRFVEVWHRRAGKDRTWAAITCMEALQRRGVYYHFLPTLGQAKRDVWDNVIMDRYDGVEHSYKMIDAVFPPELRVGKPNETEMQINLVGGSVWQLMGAENIDAINRARGSNPVGLVLSEYAFMDYDPWSVLMPVLLENNGWIAFISTPNVEDDNFHILYKSALRDPKWYAQLLTIEDTRRDAEGEDRSPVVSREDIDAERNKNTTEEDIQREFYCSFRGYMRGTIYGDVITAAESSKRISRFPYIPQLPVGVCIDLGHSDAMSVWFYQARDKGIYFIDYWEATLKDIKDVAHMMREDRQYQYGRVVLPWDGRAAANYMEEVGFNNVVVCQRNRMESTGPAGASLHSQINEVRLQFNRFYFDEVTCAVGLNHLGKYARKYDREKKIYVSEPNHDEHSHAADALRTGVAGGFEPLQFAGQFQQGDLKVESMFDPRGDRL
jgi:hypothetical protein